jgi:hypothetical protein
MLSSKLPDAIGLLSIALKVTNWPIPKSNLCEAEFGVKV